MRSSASSPPSPTGSSASTSRSSDVARGLFLQHEPLGTPGLIGARAAELGIDVVSVRVDEEPHLPDAADFDLVVTLGSSESVENSGVPWIARETETLRRAIARD